MPSRFTDHLHSLLPRPCYDRPLVCAGRPETCTAILIGENPAVTTGLDWWAFWDDSTGFDIVRWNEAYREARRDQGKTDLSHTRRRIARLRDAGVLCLETNVFMNERLAGHGAGRSNADLLDLAIETLPHISAVIAHGRIAESYLASRKNLSRFRVFTTKHLRLLSYAAVDQLAADVLAG